MLNGLLELFAREGHADPQQECRDCVGFFLALLSVPLPPANLNANAPSSEVEDRAAA